MDAEKNSDDDGGSLIRAPPLEETLGIEGIYIDYEGRNPTGTHKDRIARAHVEKALEEGYSAITVGTCGNYGVAIAYYARLYGLKAFVFVPAGYTLERAGEMRALGAEVIPWPGTYEEVVAESRRFALANGIYDANPGSRPEVDYAGYSSIAEAILSEVKPDAVFVPVGNGTTLAGIWHGFRGKAKPRMIGVTTAFGNQLLWEFYGDQRREIAETPVNEPLVSEISFDLDEAMKAIKESNGYVFGFADDTARRCAELLRFTTGLSVLPASALTVAGLIKFVRKFGVSKGNFVLVLTGGVHGGESVSAYGGALSYYGWKNSARACAVL
ncbi:pyridoxal-phosphate dependent enzyme [Thermococcus zilligii]|uniref:pyridoxal-phosphate dependent enzyme n=1 Tax=Thermococcus zilligii TaxID=54076 RepID=UPI00029B2D22|nr:pyridoxal-phosphate dependent enzyme [Thermococcus zilligii]